MLRTVVIAISFIAALAAGDAAQPATDPAKRAVLICPFENQSSVHCEVAYEVATNNDPNQPKRSFKVDRYSECPRAILEDALVNLPGATILERQRVDAMLLESELGRVSGLVDGTNAAQVGKMMGAQVLIMGTILRVDSEERAFSGYGVATRNTVAKATVRVRAVDIASGAVIASGTYDGEKSYMASQFGGLADRDVAYAVIDAALKKLIADKTFLTALTGQQTQTPATTATITCAPDPAGADVLVEGVYRGSSPLKLDLPVDHPVTVRFEKAGFLPWERKILPGSVATVNPTLDPKPSP